MTHAIMHKNVANRRTYAASGLLALALLAPAVYIFLNAGGTLAALAVLGVLACAAIAALRWPVIGLGALAVLETAAVSQNLSLHFGLPPVGQPVVLGVAVLLGLRFVRTGERPFVSASAWAALLAYVALCFATVLYARDWDLSLATSYATAKTMVVVLVTLAAIRTPSDLRAFFNVVLVTLAVICLLGFYRYLSGDPSSLGGFAAIEFVQRRFAGPITDANFFALTLVTFLPVAVGRVLYGPSRGDRIFGALTGAILAAGLMLTGSRGGLVAALVSMAVFVMILQPHHRWRAILLIAAVGLASTAFLSEALLARLSFLIDPTAAAPTADIAVQGRLASWAVAQKLFVDHPLLGVGIGNFNAYFQNTALDLGLIFRGEARSAHSLYFEIAAELGLVGLAGLLGLFALALAVPFRVAQTLDRRGDPRFAQDCRALGIGLVAMFVARLFLHDDYPTHMWTLIGLSLGLHKLMRVQPRTSDA